MGSCIILLDVVTVTHETANHERNVGDTKVVHRMAFVEDAEDDDCIVNIVYTREVDGLAYCSPDIKEGRIELRGIESYDGPATLPTDVLFTDNVLLEEGSCLNLNQRNISKNTPLKKVLGYLIQDSRELLYHLVVQRHKKSQEDTKKVQTMSYKAMLDLSK